MLKMLLDPMGGIILTNDGHAILREIDVSHPAAKTMLELCRAQDEEVGDGTTGVVVLAGEVMGRAETFLERGMHPLIIIKGFKEALKTGLKGMERVSKPINIESDQEMMDLLSASLGTKFAAQWTNLICGMALQAVRIVCMTHSVGSGVEIDIKRYVKVERIPGGAIEDSCLIPGVILNKDVIHGGMRRRIDNPRILLIDCPLEYKKGESQTNIEVQREGEWSRYLELEEEQVREMCEMIVAFKPDLLVAEKGVSDLAQHYLVQANVSALRRVKKSDMNRIARATGGTVVSRLEDLRESDIGKQCGVFRIDKIGDEYFSFIEECKDAKACTILLRGPTKDILAELDRNLQDVMADCRNILLSPKLVPGGGATEMAIAGCLEEHAKGMQGVEKGPFLAVAEALECIPRTLIQNCGGDVVKRMSELRAKHATSSTGEASFWGIDGISGQLQDMNVKVIEESEGSRQNVKLRNELAIWEPFAVKAQTLKAAIETACMILRVDDIVAAKAQKKETVDVNPEDAPGEHEGGGHEH